MRPPSTSGWASSSAALPGVHGAAVLDGDAVGSGLAVHRGDALPDGVAHFIGLLGRGGLAGANGPHGLVGDDDPLQLLLGDAAQGNLGLHGNQLAGDALLPLLQGLTHRRG